MTKETLTESGTPYVFNIDGLFVVTGGSGDFAGATGELTKRGQLDRRHFPPVATALLTFVGSVAVVPAKTYALMLTGLAMAFSSPVAGTRSTERAAHAGPNGADQPGSRPTSVRLSASRALHDAARVPPRSTSAVRRSPTAGCARVGVEGDVAGRRRHVVLDERAVDDERARRRQLARRESHQRGAGRPRRDVDHVGAEDGVEGRQAVPRRRREHVEQIDAARSKSRHSACDPSNASV
jgi:hypothetical protein